MTDIQKEMIKKDLEEDVLVNIQYGIIEQARKDYIKGARILISIFKEPMEKILNNNRARDMIMKARPGHKTAELRHIYWYKDARTFVEKDPYDMFNGNQEMIFKAWNQMAMEEHIEYQKRKEKEYERELKKARNETDKTRKTNSKLHEKKEKDDI